MNIRPKIQNNISEQEYRTIKDRLSYSSIKIYNEDPLSFYKEFVLCEPVKREKSKDLIIGDAVDTLLLQGEEIFHQKFEISSISELKKDQNQMNTFTHNLWDITIQHMDEEGIITKEFSELAEMAYNSTKYDYNGQEVAFKRKGDTLEAIIERFFGSDCELWYNQKRKNMNKTCLSLSDLDNVEKIILSLKSSLEVKDVILQQDEEGIEVHNQFSILFDYMDLQVKCLLDKMIIDHNRQLVFPYDLKCTWDILEFENKYLKYGYYIQNAVYSIGVDRFIQDNLPGYKQVPMQFIVAHSANLYQPMIYKTDYNDFIMATQGFIAGGRRYNGLHSILERIKWSINNQSWNTAPMGMQIKDLQINYK